MRLGVDVGGTFTDLVVIDGDRLRAAKVPSTRPDESRGVLAAVDELGIDLTEVAAFAHGTTVATNTLLERDGARTVLVVTRGFRDVLEIGRQHRPDLYDLDARRPEPLVPRELVVEAGERIGPDGEIVAALDDPGRVADEVAGHGPEAAAVCLLFSFRDAGHERAIGDEIAARTDAAVSLSSDVLPVFREFERASTTVLNAYVAPRLSSYLERLTSRTRNGGLTSSVEVMRSSGGTFTAELAARYPVHTLLSGPAAGAWGAAAVARRSQRQDVIAFDMGGTSTDVTLIEGGRPTTTSEGEIGGLPFAVRTTDVHTVGAGGGSIAWRDEGGSLRVGPRSAGADPGPAAYGRGGELPTVTDAHVVLGDLSPGTTLGGSVTLDLGAATRAVASLADELGLGVEETAAGIVAVTEANIARALRVVSVERGRDPRRYALVAFGGAGPLHQGALARELGCPLTIVPPHAGVLAALGLLAAPITAEEARTHLVPLAEAHPGSLRELWTELEETARTRLAEQSTEVDQLRWSADLRYRGQAYELEVEIAQGEAELRRLAEAFHAVHEERYGYAQPDEPVELVNARVRAEGPTPPTVLPTIPDGRGADAAVTGERDVLVEGARRTCRVYDRGGLGAGDRFEGPAIVEGADTTCLVLPDQSCEVDEVGSLLIRS